MHGKAAKQAFEIKKEDDRVRDRYGRNPLGQNLLLARRLIEAGVRLVNVAAGTGLVPGEKFRSVEPWAMHGNAGVVLFAHGRHGLSLALPPSPPPRQPPHPPALLLAASSVVLPHAGLPPLPRAG